MIIDHTTTTFRFRVSEQVESALAATGVYFTLHMNSRGLGDGQIISAPRGKVVEPFVVFGHGMACGAGFASFVGSPLPPETVLGRYCSIAPNVTVLSHSHPLDRFTTSSITYGDWSTIDKIPRERLGGDPMKLEANVTKPPPIIEDDVWVGQNVLLARGITLGTGCVIAAGSVVTKSVPPYAIVGGNPAAVIRYRMSEELRERYMAVRWWRYAFPHFAKLNTLDALSFIEEIENESSAGKLIPYEPVRIDLYEVIEGAMREADEDAP